MKKLNNIFSRAGENKIKAQQEGKEAPVTVEGQGKAEDQEPGENEENENQVGLSLCKSLISVEMSDEDLISVFDDNLLDFESFATFSREYLTHPELMIRIHDSLYLPEDGIPQIISLLAYNRVLDQNPPLEEQEDIQPVDNDAAEIGSPSKK